MNAKTTDTKPAAKADTKADAKPTADADASTGAKKDIVPSKYRDQYAANKGTCGDFIASELTALMDSDGIDAFKTVKKANDIPEASWAGLNNGQQRMNLSNALRARFLRGETITIMGKEYSLEASMDEFIDDPAKFNGDSEPQVRKFLGFLDMPENNRNMTAIRKFFFVLPQKAVEKAKKEEAKAKAKADKEAKAAETKAAKEKAAAEKKAAAEAKKAEGGKESKKG